VALACKRDYARQADEVQHDDVQMGSYGLDQCLDLVEASLRRATDIPPPDACWRVGTGIALAMIHTIPPRGHFAQARIVPLGKGRYELTVGTAGFGNGTTTVHAQIAASVLKKKSAHGPRSRPGDRGAAKQIGRYGL
jgi:putative selenate reductase molybdopterin-binding subunit